MARRYGRLPSPAVFISYNGPCFVAGHYILQKVAKVAKMAASSDPGTMGGGHLAGRSQLIPIVWGDRSVINGRDP